jgi:hypothetical protein
VSEELATAVCDTKMTGVVFVKPEDRRVFSAPPWRPSKG